MVDTVYYGQTKIGTSTYRGSIFTFGLHFQQERYSVGLTVRPPMEITRTWDRDVASVDTTRKPFPVRIDSLTTRRYHESGKDYVDFPFSYSLGIMLKPTDKWTIAFDYELRHLADVELTSAANSTASHPWANTKGALRLGAEYRASDLLALRGGYREDVQAFSPDGSAIINEPARGGIYSLGAGIAIGNILMDLAYEYSILKYQDVYQSNVNYNTREQHQFMVEFAYRF
jgi:long-subunit fatty acid transport protein